MQADVNQEKREGKHRREKFRIWARAVRIMAPTEEARAKGEMVKDQLSDLAALRATCYDLPTRWRTST